MKISSLFAICAMALALSACFSNKTQSTITSEKIGYAISRERAKSIVDSSILANFSPDYVNSGPEKSLTSSGYIRLVLDTHTITATALPVQGILPNGKKADGYGFMVNSFGTIPQQGERKAKDIYQLLKQQASTSGPVIRLE